MLKNKTFEGREFGSVEMNERASRMLVDVVPAVPFLPPASVVKMQALRQSLSHPRPFPLTTSSELTKFLPRISTPQDLMQEPSRCNATDTFVVRLHHILHLSRLYVPDFGHVQLHFVVVIDIRWRYRDASYCQVRLLEYGMIVRRTG